MLLLNARHVSALTLQSQLTPGHTAAGDLTVSIQSKPVDHARSFTVTIVPAGGKQLSPFFYSKLSLYRGSTALPALPVKPTREGNKLTYRFQVAPQLLTNSMFQFDEGLYQIKRDEKGTPQKDARGNVRYEPMIGGFLYWFRLKDFADQPAH